MTALRCLAGYILACVAGAAVQVLFVLTPPELLAFDAERLAAAGLWLMLTSVHAMAIAAPFALIGLILCEKWGIRGLGSYAVAGFGFGLALFLPRYLGSDGRLPGPVLQYALAANACSGLAAGLAYWAVAGRHAGASRRPEARAGSAGPTKKPIAKELNA